MAGKPSVLVTGATGLIGSALVARLVADGHSVTALARRGGRAMPGTRRIVFDIARATRPEDWLPHLAAIDAVVNCAGVLQDGPADSTRGVHVEGIGALFAACERVGTRRVVQISAIGVDRAAATRFSQSKLEGDHALMDRALDWVILRPSVVLGPAAYGGSALFRGLAALPILPVVPDTGLLQVVQLDDVLATVLFFLRPGAPSRVVLDLAGPDRLTFTEIVQRYRYWLGWPEASLCRLPRWFARLMLLSGDVAGMLGWRSPVRSTGRRELRRGATGDPRPWTALTGIVPASIDTALAARPPSVQERWFAGLYLLKPTILVVLALFWVLTGALSLGPALDPSAGLLREAGAGPLSEPGVVIGGVVDTAVGAAMLPRRTVRWALWASIALSGFYVTAATILLPRLWLDPLGPLLKVFPIVALTIVALAILDDR